MRTTWIVLATTMLMIAALDSGRAASRYESTRSLKQVVYSGSPAEYEQLASPEYDGWVFAIIPVPEISLNKMPTVQIYVDVSYHFPTTWNLLSDTHVDFADGSVYLLWKSREGGAGMPLYWHTLYTAFKIVVTYEAGVTLDVQNSGTGKSLDLDWSADATVTNKIQGYEVHRRPKQ